MNHHLVNLVLRAVALAMGIAVFVLNILSVLDGKTAISLLSIGLFCLAISQLDDEKPVN